MVKENESEHVSQKKIQKFQKFVTCYSSDLKVIIRPRDRGSFRSLYYAEC